MRRRDLILAGVASAIYPPMFTRGALGETMRDLVVTRSFDAPVETVWAAWTQPELVMQWWGPTGWTCPVANMDVRVGGVSLVAMRSPEGFDIYSNWAYTEVRPHEYFSYVFNLADGNGNVIDPTSIGMPPDFPRDARHDVLLRPLHGSRRTEMTMTEFGYTNDQLFELSRQGLEQCLDKMAAIFAALEQQ